jgi:hypothetical protein
MRNSFYILLLVVFSACQTIKVKNNTYKVSETAPELGSIGQSKMGYKANDEFEVKTLARLENNIRVGIEIIPFNKKMHKIYAAKAKYNQDQLKVAYVDSLPVKPELATIKLLDVVGFVNELNADYNAAVYKYISNTQNSEVVTNLVFCFTLEEINKIKQADAFYLTNYQDSKYAISLYKLGKKTDTLFLNSSNVVAYRLSTFCWGETDRGQSYIADMIEGSNNCKGNTKSKIEDKKKSKSLFDM